MQLLKSALNVLRNMCKNRATCTSVFAVADSIDILVELMQMYRDKHDIFLKACSVLRHVCKIRQQREVRSWLKAGVATHKSILTLWWLQAIVNMDAIMSRLNGIMHIIELKYQREAEHISRMQLVSASRPRSGPLQHLKAQVESVHNLVRMIQS